MKPLLIMMSLLDLQPLKKNDMSTIIHFEYEVDPELLKKNGQR